MDERDCPAESSCPVEVHLGHCAVHVSPPRYRGFTDPVADALAAIRIAFDMWRHGPYRRIFGIEYAPHRLTSPHPGKERPMGVIKDQDGPPEVLPAPSVREAFRALPKHIKFMAVAALLSGAAVIATIIALG